MPHHKSCKKRMKTSKAANERNRATKSRVRTAVKGVLSASSSEDAQAKLKTAYSVIDKAAKSGVMHKKTAANRKASMARAAAKAAA